MLSLPALIFDAAQNWDIACPVHHGRRRVATIIVADTLSGSDGREYCPKASRVSPYEVWLRRRPTPDQCSPARHPAISPFSERPHIRDRLPPDDP